jgi:hypothetical protein
LNLYALIQRMTVFHDQARAAGHKEARGSAVMTATRWWRSPRSWPVNKGDVIAQSRMHDEVLRMVAMNRLWTRAYRVNCAGDESKCPQVMAMKFVNYLQDQDLKAIMKSKDVPTVASTTRAAPDEEEDRWR